MTISPSKWIDFWLFTGYEKGETEKGEHVLVVHGSGFSKEKGAGHFRLVYLADEDTLNTAFDRIESFLARHK